MKTLFTLGLLALACFRAQAIQSPTDEFTSITRTIVWNPEIAPDPPEWGDHDHRIWEVTETDEFITEYRDTIDRVSLQVGRQSVGGYEVGVSISFPGQSGPTQHRYADNAVFDLTGATMDELEILGLSLIQVTFHFAPIHNPNPNVVPDTSSTFGLLGIGCMALVGFKFKRQRDGKEILRADQ